MFKKFQTLVFAVAAIGLSACNQQDRATGPQEKNRVAGAARMALPVIPKDYLAGLGAGVVANFELTITGDGMQPIQHNWKLYPGGQAPVLIQGIPVGLKVFSGRLMKMDTTTMDTIVTHEGGDRAWIEKDSITDVRLYLKKVGGGGANICVEVEGWPSDPGCKPPVPVYPNFGGCWNVAITKHLGAPHEDTVFTGNLRIMQKDSNLAAVLTWKSGAADTAYGHVRSSDGTAIIGYYLGYGDFTFKGGLDSSEQSMFGWFTDSSRGIFGNLNGKRGYCDSIIEPPDPDTVVTACFSIAQALNNGRGGSGRMVLRQSQGVAWGTMNWAGYAPMSVPPGAVTGSILDSGVVFLQGHPPKGMFDISAKVDSMAYKGRILPNGGIIDANVYQILPGATKALGVWKGYREACTSKDSLP